tara:strand:- start:403 stop:618 length:216 start_codon:yes stop_codon:yes gene_type:complete
MKKNKLNKNQPSWEIKQNWEVNTKKMGEQFNRRHEESLQAKNFLIEKMKEKLKRSKNDNSRKNRSSQEKDC